jgi:hypothetical protein
MDKPKIIAWKWGVWAALAMMLLALWPQINMWIARGGNWQGSYVSVQGDEMAYSAYINALIAGRPRRNDPFMGKDDVPSAPLPESLFSIQFIPAYAVALPARALHLSAATAFILFMVLSAIISSLAIFWFLNTVTGDARVAAAGTLVALCLGTLAAGQGEAIFMLRGQNVYDSFPYLRRYQPSVAFPLFFVFCTFLWRSLPRGNRRSEIRSAVWAGLIFTVLVFSYFYLWTAAAALFAALGLLWCVARPGDWRHLFLSFAIIAGISTPAIVSFFLLLFRRSASMDSTQLLFYSHAPDLLYVPELIGFAIVGALVLAAWRRKVDLRDPTVLFTASLALMPFLVFNQQILTGRSLQPIHYQVFIANYAALVSLVLASLVLTRRDAYWKIPNRALIYVALVAFAWGVVELAGSTRRNAAYARIRDDSMPVLKRLAEIAKQDGTYERARLSGAYPVVYSTNLTVAGNLATVAPQGVLWAHHTPAAGVASLDQSKELYFHYLYYSGVDEKELAQALLEGQFSTLTALFGVERVITTLTPYPKPITVQEMRAEVRRYSEFINSFSRERASHPLLSYVLAPSQAEPNYANLDRWYERDSGERVGIYLIYRLRLRD